MNKITYDRKRRKVYMTLLNQNTEGYHTRPIYSSNVMR